MLLGPGICVKHPLVVGQHLPQLPAGCGALAAYAPAGCQVIPRDAAAPPKQPSDTLGRWQWFGWFLLSALEVSAGRGHEWPRRAAAASRAAKLWENKLKTKEAGEQRSSAASTIRRVLPSALGEPKDKVTISALAGTQINLAGGMRPCVEPAGRFAPSPSPVSGVTQHGAGWILCPVPPFPAHRSAIREDLQQFPKALAAIPLRQGTGDLTGSAGFALKRLKPPS